MAYSAVPKYKNQFTNYAMIAYGDELKPTIIGDVLDFNIGLRRDKMPIFTIGKNNGVSIIRKGRLVEGSFARFAANGKETQATLLSNIDKSKFPKVYELVENTVTPEEIMQSVKENSSFYDDFTTADGVVEKTQQLADAGLSTELKFFSRPGIRLSDFNGLNMVLVGIPESAIEENPDKFPEKVLLVKISEIYFQGTSVNITIDNPNIIEQVAFYQKRMHVYVEGPEFNV